eukprot:4880759-Amphidinium_carterae.2
MHLHSMNSQMTWAMVAYALLQTFGSNICIQGSVKDIVLWSETCGLHSFEVTLGSAVHRVTSEVLRHQLYLPPIRTSCTPGLLL